MSVVETIRGLRKMSLADGAAATPPPSPRSAQSRLTARSVAAVVAALGGLDGLRAILMEYWSSDQINAVIAEDCKVPQALVDLLKDLEEALCRGFLEEQRAVDMAVRRVQLLIEENITLPLTPVDKERVFQLIRENEEDDWKLMIETMTQSFPALLVSK